MRDNHSNLSHLVLLLAAVLDLILIKRKRSKILFSAVAEKIGKLS